MCAKSPGASPFVYPATSSVVSDKIVNSEVEKRLSEIDLSEFNNALDEFRKENTEIKTFLTQEEFDKLYLRNIIEPADYNNQLSPAQYQQRKIEFPEEAFQALYEIVKE